jgi:hypothetical protein
MMKRELFRDDPGKGSCFPAKTLAGRRGRGQRFVAIATICSGRWPARPYSTIVASPIVMPGLHWFAKVLNLLAMSTLMEIEKAVAALPSPQQEELFRHLAERLKRRSEPRRRLPVVPATGNPITQEEINDALDSD